jgi:hypothetical protein
MPSTATTPSIGRVVLDPDAARQACVDVKSNATAIGVTMVTLAPTGLAVIQCSPVVAGSDTTTDLVGFDLLQHTRRWQLSIQPDEDYRVGQTGVYVVQHHSEAATGLADAQQSYTLTSYDLTAGQQRWSVPLEDWLPSAQRTAGAATGLAISSLFEITEGPSGQAGINDVVAVLNGTTALSVDHGSELWHTARTYRTLASGRYVTSGVVEVYGRTDNDYDTHRTGIDPRTDQVMWDLRLPEPEDATGYTNQVIGTQEWAYRDTRFVVYDIATGNIVRSAQLPQGWTNVHVSPAGVLAIVDGKLQLSKLNDPASVVWSVPASASSKILATAGATALLTVPAGYAVVALADGEVVNQIPGTAGDITVVDGMVSLAGIDSVVELDSPTTS